MWCCCIFLTHSIFDTPAIFRINNLMLPRSTIAKYALAVLAASISGTVAEKSDNAQQMVSHDDVRVVPKNPAQDCVYLSDLNSTFNRASFVVKNIVDTLEEVPMMQKALTKARKNAVRICLAQLTSSDDPGKDIDAPRKRAFYDLYNAVMVLDEASIKNCGPYIFSHELQHAVQGLEELALRAGTSEENLEIALELEFDAHVIQAMTIWMLSRKEFVDSPVQDQRHCYPLRRPDMIRATDLLDKIYATHPEWIENGQAAKELFEFFKADGTIWEKYKASYEADGSPEYTELMSKKDNPKIAQFHKDDSGVHQEFTLREIGRLYYGFDYRTLPRLLSPTPGS